MEMLNIKIVHVRYNALSGLAWLAFWSLFVFFLGVVLQMWTLESTTVHLWWIASAFVITVSRPFKTVTVTDLKIPADDPRIQ